MVSKKIETLVRMFSYKAIVGIDIDPTFIIELYTKGKFRYLVRGINK